MPSTPPATAPSTTRARCPPNTLMHIAEACRTCSRRMHARWCIRGRFSTRVRRATTRYRSPPTASTRPDSLASSPSSRSLTCPPTAVTGSPVSCCLATSTGEARAVASLRACSSAWSTCTFRLRRACWAASAIRPRPTCSVRACRRRRRASACARAYGQCGSSRAAPHAGQQKGDHMLARRFRRASASARCCSATR